MRHGYSGGSGTGAGVGVAVVVAHRGMWRLFTSLIAVDDGLADKLSSVWTSVSRIGVIIAE